MTHPEDTTIPVGLCQCGCGRPTRIVNFSNARLGRKRGQPARFVTGHYLRNKPPMYRVDPQTGCWEWLWAKSRKGYGTIQRDGRSKLAYGYFHEQACGPIPDGMMQDHLCRNRGCVNPAHIEVVTAAENARRGVNTKLDAAKVAQIRALLGTKRRSDIALRFGVSRSAIDKIAVGRTWK